MDPEEKLGERLGPNISNNDNKTLQIFTPMTGNTF